MNKNCKICTKNTRRNEYVEKIAFKISILTLDNIIVKVVNKRPISETDFDSVNDNNIIKYNQTCNGALIPSMDALKNSCKLVHNEIGIYLLYLVITRIKFDDVKYLIFKNGHDVILVLSNENTSEKSCLEIDMDRLQYLLFEHRIDYITNLMFYAVVICFIVFNIVYIACTIN